MTSGRSFLRRGLVPAVVALTALSVTCAEPGERASDLPRTAGSSETDRRIAGLTARGSVSGLYPGARIGMRVRIRNPYDHAVRITSLRVRAGRAAPGCRGSWVKVRRLRREVIVPAHDRRPVLLRVRMRRGAPDACQGARFPLRFRIAAVRA